MIQAKLPRFLRHNQSERLVRLGSSFDGGYVVAEQDIFSAQALIGLGISNNWDFEKDFLERNVVPLYAYDGSISANIFFRRFVKSLHKVHKPHIAADYFKSWKNYRAFFSGNRQHFKKFVAATTEKKQISMGDIFSQVQQEKVFLKIDIEGSEYRILDEIIAYENRLTGLVIEFHDCDLHMQWIERFVRGLSLPLVHIHANDCCPVSRYGIPHALELTFSKNAQISDEARIYPQSIDRPNAPDSQPIRLSFED